MSVMVIQAAGDFIQDVPTIMFVPIILYVFLLLYFVYWAYTVMLVYSSGTEYHPPGSSWGKIRITDDQRIYIWTNVIMMFWNLSFFLALSQFIVACSTCIWYFGEHRNVGVNPVSMSAVWALTFHIGSLALASFLLAIVWIIRFVSQYIHVRASLNLG